MKNSGKLTVTPQGDCEIIMTRAFDAPRELVFDALTRPEMLERWFGVFAGWTLAVCEVDLRVGGEQRYVWQGPDGARMGVRGVFHEVARPERLVATWAFDESWYPGEEIGTMEFLEEEGRTTLINTVRYESREARDIVIKSDMEKGVALGYDILDELLASEFAEGASQA